MQKPFGRVIRVTVRVAALSFLSLSFVTDVRSQQPSFNCITDRGPDERTICASVALSQLDRQLDALYTAVRVGFDADHQILLRDTQRIWLQLRAACGTNANCIAGLYRTRIARLQTMLAGSPEAPPVAAGTPRRPPATGGTGDACDAFPTLC
jgi:uncharacterized protein